MCCEYPDHHDRGGPVFQCCCGGFSRRFVSAAEKKERLERYREQLKKELAGLDEKLKDMA